MERPHDLLFFANFPHTVGVAYFFVFGSQRDVFRVWCFWRKDDTVTKTATTESETPFVEDPTMLREDASAASLPDRRRGMDEVVRPRFFTRLHLQSSPLRQIIALSEQAKA